MRLLLIISLLFTISCSNTRTITDTDTRFNYVLAPVSGDSSPLKKVVIATVNHSKRSPTYLRRQEYKVDKLVIDYLKKQGIEVLTGNQFETFWARGMSIHGNYQDPYSAGFRHDRFDAILGDTLKALKEEYGVDGIIFTDLMPKSVSFARNSPHFAVWDGVKRRARIRGDKKVPRDFNWSKRFQAVSLGITVFHADNSFLFNSVGGLDVIDVIDTRSGAPEAKRNNSMLSEKNLIMEGIALAFHPLINMND